MSKIDDAINLEASKRADREEFYFLMRLSGMMATPIGKEIDEGRLHEQLVSEFNRTRKARIERHENDIATEIATKVTATKSSRFCDEIERACRALSEEGWTINLKTNV